eukprot:4279813-Amphidinium_carterae.1
MSCQNMIRVHRQALQAEKTKTLSTGDEITSKTNHKRQLEDRPRHAMRSEPQETTARTIPTLPLTLESAVSTGRLTENR